ncbi:MAG: glycosyltransferase family 1 protein [Bacteroidetes bacterium]|nr:glycosyltransferase family 1 protein [Bacteroidota bacterium]MDA0873934.1 glycosyltransferase family 1 protein [Bacteroidota bacterium]
MPDPRQAKRIALFTGAYNHVVDGVALTLNRLVSFLEGEGVPVRVFAPTIAEPPIDHAGTLVAVPSIPMQGRPEYRVSLGLGPDAIEALDRFQPTIVHIATPDLVGLEALLYARMHGIPVVASYHTHFSSYLEYYRLAWAERAMWVYLRWFYGKCEHLYVPTRSMAAVLAEHGIRHGVELWPRGVDIRQFDPSHRSMEWRRSLGFQDADVVVTFVSRLVVEKGLDVFAEVVRTLQREGEPVRCLVVGEGPARDLLQEAVPRAVFLGHKEGADLARAYASSDIFLFPSETETFGNVTLEAMASGLPTVCADATGSSSLVLHEQTGFLVPGRDVAGFANRIRQLVHDAALRQQMGQAARSEAETYSWRLILGRINAYYDTVLDP